MIGGEAFPLSSPAPVRVPIRERPTAPTLSGKKFLERPRGVHQKPTPLLESGLVNFDYLATYMHRNPRHVPLYKTPGWKYHHAYHTEASFRQTHLDETERDERMVFFRNSSYNQLHLRVINEWIYHLYHRIQVPWPPEDTVDMALRDISRIDALGAASLALATTKNNTANYSIDPASINPTSLGHVALQQKLEFLGDMREDTRRELGNVEVLPPRMVTSAVQRLGRHLQGDQYLTELAETRLELDPVFYPVRVPSHKTLQMIANTAMIKEFGQMERPPKEWPKPRSRDVIAEAA